jgi:hypothetical protein
VRLSGCGQDQAADGQTSHQDGDAGQEPGERAAAGALPRGVTMPGARARHHLDELLAGAQLDASVMFSS